MTKGERPASVLLRPVGPLDADTCGQLRYQLAAAFAADVTSVVVDLSEVPSLDVVGLGVLTGAAKHLNRRDGQLLLAHPSAEVLTTLRINDVERLLEVGPSTPQSASAPSREPRRRLRSVPGAATTTESEIAQPG
jgi:anti-anti-sigma factor